MVKKIRLLKIFFLSFCILFVSCNSNIDLHNISSEVSIDPSLIVPIGGASANLGEILAYNVTRDIFEKNVSEINFQTFDSTEFRFPTLNLIDKVPRFIKTLYVSRNSVDTLPPNFNIPTINSDADFDLGLNTQIATERIDSLKISAATLGIIVSVNNLDIDPSNLKFTLSFAGGKMRMLDGSATSFVFTPKAFNQIENRDFFNFIMNTSGGANGIPLNIKLDANTGGLPLAVGPNSTISIEFNFNRMDWEVMYGKFDLSKIASTAVQIPIDLDKILLNGMYKLSNPQIDISAVSNIGIKLGFRLDYLKSIFNTDSIYAMFGGQKSFSKYFDTKPKSPGDTAMIKLPTFDKDWGKTDKLVENKPQLLEYKVTAFSDNQNDLTQSFITPDANLKVRMKTTVPLQFNSGSYYQFNDTILNIFQPIANVLDRISVANIEYTSLVLDITNGLPVKTELSVSLLDSLDNEINLTSNFNKIYEIVAGKVDSNGIVQPGQETKQQLSISITNDQLVEVRKANKIAYKVRVENGDLSSKMYFTKSNTLNLKVGLYVKGNLK